MQNRWSQQDHYQIAKDNINNIKNKEFDSEFLEARSVD